MVETRRRPLVVKMFNGEGVEAVGGRAAAQLSRASTCVKPPASRAEVHREVTVLAREFGGGLICA